MKKHRNSRDILFSVKVIDDLTGEKILEIKNASREKFIHKMNKHDRQLTKLIMEKFK